MRFTTVDTAGHNRKDTIVYVNLMCSTVSIVVDFYALAPTQEVPIWVKETNKGS